MEKKWKKLIKKKISEVSGLVNTTVPNTKIGEVERKIPDVIVLVATTILNTKIEKAESKSVRGLVTDYNAKIRDNEAKYFTCDFNKSY